MFHCYCSFSLFELGYLLGFQKNNGTHPGVFWQDSSMFHSFWPQMSDLAPSGPDGPCRIGACGERMKAPLYCAKYRVWRSYCVPWSSSCQFFWSLCRAVRGWRPFTKASLSKPGLGNLHFVGLCAGFAPRCLLPWWPVAMDVMLEQKHEKGIPSW